MITIAPYTAAYESIVGPFIVSIQNEFGVPATLAGQPDLSAIEASYLHSGGNFWLALHNGNLVGTIALLRADDHVGVIRKMFVAPNYRGAPHKVGQQLFDVLMAWARSNHFTQLYLGTIDVFTAALKFYEKNGFSLLPEAALPPKVSAMKMHVDNTYFTRKLVA